MANTNTELAVECKDRLIVDCPCGLKAYEKCCGVYHCGEALPDTPEALMRSRYSAYALAKIDYIAKTMKGKPLEGFNASDADKWARSVKWLGLKIIHSKEDSPMHGYVEFIAKFIENGQHQSLHEISEFSKEDGQWYYVDGQYTKNPLKKNQLK